MERIRRIGPTAVPLPGVPLIEICGQVRVLVENHQGVIGYGCHEILVKVRSGCVRIDGENLTMTKMSKEKLVITGKIHAVQLQGRG